MGVYRWLYSVADDFFTKQLPHNVTWGLTVLYALDAAKDLADVSAQVSIVQGTWERYQEVVGRAETPQ